MRTHTLIFVAFTLAVRGGFATTPAYVEISTRADRRKNHPIPGE